MIVMRRTLPLSTGPLSTGPLSTGPLSARPRLAALLLVGLLAACVPTILLLRPEAARAAGADAGRCAVPPELIEDDPRLDGIAQRFRDMASTTIVAVGGASTAGTAAGNGDANAWPHRLQEALRRRHPGVEIAVVNKGIAGQTAREMIARFAVDVFPIRPALVIWETGTVDAVRETDVEEFAAELRAGIAALRQHDAEVMLVDMQYNPGTGSVIDYQPYLDALHQVADLENVYLFRRFDIMKYWSENGAFDLVEVPKAQRMSLAAQVYGCLAERLADAVDFAIQAK
jgi:lysophospholipase L1-like esterase